LLKFKAAIDQPSPQERCGLEALLHPFEDNAGKMTLLFNRLMSRVRCDIEKIFGWWKRSARNGRVRYVGRESNRRELEFKSICRNLKQLVTLSGT
jgi:Transposase DDE domain